MSGRISPNRATTRQQCIRQLTEHLVDFPLQNMTDCPGTSCLVRPSYSQVHTVHFAILHQRKRDCPSQVLKEKFGIGKAATETTLQDSKILEKTWQGHKTQPTSFSACKVRFSPSHLHGCFNCLYVSIFPLLTQFTRMKRQLQTVSHRQTSLEEPIDLVRVDSHHNGRELQALKVFGP